MNNGKKKEFVNPTGASAISSIFLAIVRIALGIYLLYTDPLSSGFRYLLILLFFISVARHLLCYFSKPIPDNIYNFWLDLLTPCLYGFLLFHVLSIYDFDFLLLAVSIFLPAIIYILLFAGDGIPIMNKGIFWGGLLCYVLTFLLSLNYTFDFSNPVVEKYFLANKHYSTNSSDHDGAAGEDTYYFDLIHIDSISTPAQWVEVNQQTYYRYRDSWKYKRIKFDNEEFMILDKKAPPSLKLQYHFLLQKTNGPFQVKDMTELQYSRFEKGNTLHIEKHTGLLGMEWLTYR